ncbi:hypothetical protein Cgig2_019642 [Carnegiea gigantea]|uniref:BHLH domain-containing protein n=1 Tax=Carnegiea gigantea TaxID=171969 RepID=A0A9Q1KHK0_9CARY|nr:hypothetical protein Cgig2_019642 [Carnegiea gigantea]
MNLTENYLCTCRTGTSSISNTFSNKLYCHGNEFLDAGESRPPQNSLSTAILTNIDNDARNLNYLQTNLPKIEEDMLSSFSSFSSLLQNPSTTSVENPAASWFNGFPSSAQCYSNRPGLMQLPFDHGFSSTSLLNQLGLVSSPKSLSILSSNSSSTPRLGLNLQAMDFLGSNASFGSHNRPQYDPLGEEVISPSVGKTIMSNKSTSGALMNGITGTKRAAGNYTSSDQPKASTSSNNSAAPTKKSQLKVSCPPFKVRKEKLGDRIAALHQLVSPFGKTDTASVLTEAIGYIQFLQDQIHTLCMPHAKPSRSKPCRPFQMGGVEDEGKEEGRVELRRRGLCLVPLSWTSFLTPSPSQLDESNQSFF